MPTYEYECNDCGAVMEKFQKITAVPLKKCTACGGKLRRLFGVGAGIIFKGSGFHGTDYRSDSYKKKEKEENSDKGNKDSSAACQSCPQGNTCAAAKK
ncbi:MAG: zinc ribbon domain-containing protein [Candidatus Omnitrophica bacterium]|nr:zinc ribbon domain-containing protein [Candidatus Omnitrophota bacterium]